MSETFKKLADHGKALRHEFDDLQVTLERYDKNIKFISKTDNDDQDTLCCVLDNIKEMLQAQHSEISEDRKSLLTIRQKVIQASQQFMHG